MDYFSDCTPAKLYAILTMFSITGSIYSGARLTQILWSIIGGALWLFLLNWLCGKGFTWLSWFLVMFPFIILIGGLIAFIFMVGKMESEKKKNAKKEQKQ